MTTPSEPVKILGITIRLPDQIITLTPEHARILRDRLDELLWGGNQKPIVYPPAVPVPIYIYPWDYSRPYWEVTCGTAAGLADCNNVGVLTLDCTKP